MIDFKNDDIHGVILDMDGVLWRDSETIGNLQKIFERLNDLGLKTVLATNNATRSVDQYLAKFKGFGVILEDWQIVTSAMAVISYIKNKYPIGTPVHIVGAPSLINSIEVAGYPQSFEDVKVVIAGVDREISYQKISTAATLIRNGAEFLGTNPDKTFPTPHGLTPGAGAIIAAIATAAEQEPQFVGKPGKVLMQLSLERLSLPAIETLVVGDRLDTDILAAQNAGCRCALVLSGVTTADQAKLWKPSPDFIAKDLSELIGV